MCTRVVCTLAHVMEAAGLATVALPSNLRLAERMRPPRALYCEFPLGRPLGRPKDPAFQRQVLDTAFALLDRPEGPVLEKFPTIIEDEAEQPVVCPMPPRYDPSAPAAVDEAQSLRPAWERTHAAQGSTQVGRVVAPAKIPEAVGAFVRISSGTPWNEAGFESEAQLFQTVMDIRTYYEEAAMALVDHVPAARAAESWLYRSTETGKVLRAALEALKSADPPLSSAVNFYFVPQSQMKQALS